MVTVTRRALAAAFFQPADPLRWIPARQSYGEPVTHAIDPARFADRRVRLLRARPWPGLQAKKADGSYTSGPSGGPWINSNAWAIALERFRAPAAPVWVETNIPKNRVLALDDYLLTLADCASAGAKWVIDCPPEHWLAVSNAVRFFAAKADWGGFVSPGVVGVVPDDANQDLPEVMNLLGRQSIPYRLVREPEPGLAAVIVPEPSAAWTAFARDGGLVLALGGQAPKAKGEHPRWTLAPAGKGRLGVWKGEAVDPAWVAKDLRALLGREREVLRAYNIHASSVRYTVAADGQRGLVQILNFTGKPLAEETTVWVGHAWKSARQLEWTGGPQAVTVVAEGRGTELSLPRRDFYTAIELAR